MYQATHAFQSVSIGAAPSVGAAPSAGAAPSVGALSSCALASMLSFGPRASKYDLRSSPSMMRKFFSVPHSGTAVMDILSMRPNVSGSFSESALGAGGGEMMPCKRNQQTIRRDSTATHNRSVVPREILVLL